MSPYVFECPLADIAVKDNIGSEYNDKWSHGVLEKWKAQVYKIDRNLHFSHHSIAPIRLPLRWRGKSCIAGSLIILFVRAA